MQAAYYYDPYNMGSAVPMQPVIVQAPGQGVVQSPGVAVGVVPGMPQFAGIQYTLVQDPLSELNNCTSVIIRQQPELFEAIVGCETANRYHVFGQTSQGCKYLFKCLERSDFCMRCCCPSNIREFNMEMNHVINAGNQIASKKFANAYKPLKCPCFCCNRPEILVNVGDQSAYIGKIKHIFTCLDPEFEVFEASGNLKYFVHADCCQCGLMCANNMCGKFSTATFNIYSVGNNALVATITKMSAQSYSEMVTDADSYIVNFPQDATAHDKLLLIALGLLIDYQYFETDANDQGNRGGGYRRRRYGYGYY